MVADARFPETFSGFAVEAVGVMPGERQSRRLYERAQDSAQCAVTEDGQLQFTGACRMYIEGAGCGFSGARLLNERSFVGRTCTTVFVTAVVLFLYVSVTRCCAFPRGCG